MKNIYRCYQYLYVLINIRYIHSRSAQHVFSVSLLRISCARCWTLDKLGYLGGTRTLGPSAFANRCFQKAFLRPTSSLAFCRKSAFENLFHLMTKPIFILICLLVAFPIELFKLVLDVLGQGDDGVPVLSDVSIGCNQWVILG